MTESALKQRINDVIKQAMRAREKDTLRVLRMLSAELKKVEVDERIELGDDRIVAIIDKMIKQRKDAIEQFAQANRQDLIDQENFEIDILQPYLPAALSDDELQVILAKVINDTGAQSVKDMGKVMAQLKPQVQGRVDMGKVSGLIKSRLSN